MEIRPCDIVDEPDEDVSEGLVASSVVVGDTLVAEGLVVGESVVGLVAVTVVGLAPVATRLTCRMINLSKSTASDVVDMKRIRAHDRRHAPSIPEVMEI